MATEPAANAETAPAPQKKRKLPLWLIIVIATVVLGAGAGGAMALHLFGSGAASDGKTKAPSGPPLYLPLKPFVVNFQAGQMVRFLQVTVEVMSHDPKAIGLLKQNDPMVRNNLLLLLGSQKATTLETEAGKQKLRTEVLAAIRNVAAENGGKPGRIEAVYFTSFVMQ